MNEQANIDVVKQCYDAYQKGDIQRVLSCFSDDIDWELPEVEGIPFTGKRHGRDQVAEFFQQMSLLQENRNFQAQEFIAQDEKVVATGRYDFLVKATGLSYDADWCHMFTVSNGKITRFREFTDTLKAAMAYRPQAAAAARGAGAGAGAPPVH